MVRIGVPSNTKIFEAVQCLIGEEILHPKGAFFVPFRGGHELVIARVEEIVRLTKEGQIDISFVTMDHLLETGASLISRQFPEICRCDVSIITAEKEFESRNSVEVFTEFYKETGRRAVVTTRFPSFTSHFLWDVKNFKRQGKWGEDFSPAFPKMKRVSGAEELSILLGSADFAVSRVESGKTLELNNLFVVETMLSSCLVVVRHEDFLLDKAEEVLSALLNK